MAVFETKTSPKLYLDDTEPLICFIENAYNIQGHTEYLIRVQRGPFPNRSWHISKRYNEFAALNSILQASGLSLPLPPKRLIGNMHREFVAERQAALQKYLNFVLMNPILASSLPVRKFLDPDNYSLPFQEIALQHVSMALRSEVTYEIGKPCPNIGWRIRKHYFQAVLRGHPQEEKLLAWAEHGPDRHLDEKALSTALRALLHFKHPGVVPVEFVSCNEAGGFTVKTFHPSGSVRDLLCLAKPKAPFLNKYANPRQTRNFSLSEIAFYGCQILETLLFLQEKGYPYGHLHTGNLILDEKNRRIRLTDLENSLFGLPTFYRPYIVQLKRVSISLEAVDAYSFGHVLYEMAFGQPLQSATCNQLPDSCPPELRPILSSLLSTEACTKTGLPTLAQLLNEPLFNGKGRTPSNGGPCGGSGLFYGGGAAGPPGTGAGTVAGGGAGTGGALRLSGHAKDALRDACVRVEERLRAEHKQVRQQKRLARVQELLSSEEEMRKRKHKQKSHNSSDSNHKTSTMNNGSNQVNQLLANGKSPERSDSPNSTSTATSAGTTTPPPPPAAPPPEPPPPPLSLPTPLTNDRNQLLGSICNFNKATLRKVSAS